MEEKLFTEEIYRSVQVIETFCSGMIDEIRANYDGYSFTEQRDFSDLIVDYEEIIMDCQRYKYNYNENFKTATQDNLYRVVSGDTLVSIANHYFGDPTKWELIYKANNLADLDISNVETLKIPRLGR